jgi:hypothetical protein
LLAAEQAVDLAEQLLAEDGADLRQRGGLNLRVVLVHLEQRQALLGHDRQPPDELPAADGLALEDVAVGAGAGGDEGVGQNPRVAVAVDLRDVTPLPGLALPRPRRPFVVRVSLTVKLISPMRRPSMTTLPSGLPTEAGTVVVCRRMSPRRRMASRLKELVDDDGAALRHRLVDGADGRLLDAEGDAGERRSWSYCVYRRQRASAVRGAYCC